MADTRNQLLFHTPKGDMCFTDLRKSDLPYGRYVTQDQQSTAWYLPELRLEATDLNNLYFTLFNIKNYFALKSKYQQLVEKDPAVKWHLIPLILLFDELKLEAKNREIPEKISADILADKKLFQSLHTDGAEYKHMLDAQYGEISANTRKILLNLFPANDTQNNSPVKNAIHFFRSLQPDTNIKPANSPASRHTK